MQKQHPGLSRRHFIVGSAAAVTLGGATAALAGTKPASQGHEMHMMHYPAPDKAQMAVIDSALDCVQTGMACREHCVMMFQMGDNSMDECYRSVSELITCCRALAELTAINSEHLRAFMKVCVESCESCEKTCNKHLDIAACKTCAESCKACIKACKEFLAG